MKDTDFISAFGTARELFLSRAKSPEDHDESCKELLHKLMKRVRLYNMDEQQVQLAMEIVQWEKGIESEEFKALLLLVTASLILLHQGSTRLPLFDPESSKYSKYVKDIIRTLLSEQYDSDAVIATAPLADSIMDTLTRLLKKNKSSVIIGAPGDLKPLIYANNSLYHQKMFELEDTFARRLRTLIANNVPLFGQAAIEAGIEAIDGNPFRLSDEQKAAVLCAVHRPFTVISGGPGTGKTAVIASILRVLIRLGVPPENIALTAPTGKAANRMTESIQRALKGCFGEDEKIAEVAVPRTLHRLLGYSPSTERFRSNENNCLTERFVILDEGSMVDLFLMDRIIRSLRDDARLIVLGDADQLPSVQAGAVFKDLVSQDKSLSSPPPWKDNIVTLLHNYRMDETDSAGQSILAVARSINSGQACRLLTGEDAPDMTVTSQPENLRLEKVEFYECHDDHSLKTFLQLWYSSFIKAGSAYSRLIRKEYRYYEKGFSKRDSEDLLALFGYLNSSKLLCLTRVYNTGTETINKFFHAMMLTEGNYDFGPDFVPGEPVIMLHNDYGKNIFNGDQGIVLRVADNAGKHHFMVVFRRTEDFGVFHLDSLRTSIEHSFAITVHKSQGSEFDNVGLILPAMPMPLLTKEILYTAVTRSRKSVTLVGNKDIFVEGVRNTVQRFTGITEKLRNLWVDT